MVVINNRELGEVPIKVRVWSRQKCGLRQGAGRSADPGRERELGECGYR
jgi:hypothetical protein